MVASRFWRTAGSGAPGLDSTVVHCVNFVFATPKVLAYCYGARLLAFGSWLSALGVLSALGTRLSARGV